MSRLMQRRSVLLPAPDEPMMAVMPLPSTVRSSPFSTGSPRPYDFTSFSIRSSTG